MTAGLIGDVVLLDGSHVDIGVIDGDIASVTPSDPTATMTIDGRGRLALPGFVESHVHLDKAHLGGAGGSLADAIAMTAARKRDFTPEDVAVRARRTLLDAVAAGTTTVRAHTEIDPGVGLLSVEALDALRAELDHLVRVQLVAFPQEGLEARPGTLPLIREALRFPDTVVGGCPYVEADIAAARRHVDTVLDLAAEHEVPADLHLDLADSTDDPRFTLAGYVARGAAERGLRGRVAIGHVTTLGLMAGAEQLATLDALAEAQVTVTVLPATDLFLTGRDGRTSPTRGLAPVRDLWAAGVPTALSSNNIRNAFTPTGRADLLDIALLLVRVAHLADLADLRRVIEMATVGGARAVDPQRPAGVTPGAPADLVLIGGTSPDTVILDQPADRLVLRRGAPVAERTTTTSRPTARALSSMHHR